MKTAPLALFSDVSIFGCEVELVKAWDSSGRGQTATNVTSYLIGQGLLVILILFGVHMYCKYLGTGESWKVLYLNGEIAQPFQSSHHREGQNSGHQSSSLHFFKNTQVIIFF